jgi:hypothetical protein
MFTELLPGNALIKSITIQSSGTRCHTLTWGRGNLRLTQALGPLPGPRRTSRLQPSWYLSALTKQHWGPLLHPWPNLALTICMTREFLILHTFPTCTFISSPVISLHVFPSIEATNVSLCEQHHALHNIMKILSAQQDMRNVYRNFVFKPWKITGFLSTDQRIIFKCILQTNSTTACLSSPGPGPSRMAESYE